MFHFAEDLKNNNKNHLARIKGSASICSVLGSTFILPVSYTESSSLGAKGAIADESNLPAWLRM